MSIMQDYAPKYYDPIQDVIRLNTLREEYESKINRLNALKKKNSTFNNEYHVIRDVRSREIKKLESELFHNRGI